MNLTQWKQIPHHPNYEVNQLGKVRNKNTKTLLSSIINKHGFLRVSLKNSNGKQTQVHVANLVATAFISPDVYRVSYKNENKLDCRLTNLAVTLRKDPIVEQIHEAIESVKNEPLENEEFRPVKGYENRYEISNLGRCLSFVKSGAIKQGEIIRGGKIIGKTGKHGYMLSDGSGRTRFFTVAQLMNDTFPELQKTTTANLDIIRELESQIFSMQSTVNRMKSVVAYS